MKDQTLYLLAQYHSILLNSKQFAEFKLKSLDGPLKFLSPNMLKARSEYTDQLNRVSAKITEVEASILWIESIQENQKEPA